MGNTLFISILSFLIICLIIYIAIKLLINAEKSQIIITGEDSLENLDISELITLKNNLINSFSFETLNNIQIKYKDFMVGLDNDLLILNKKKVSFSEIHDQGNTTKRDINETSSLSEEDTYFEGDFDMETNEPINIYNSLKDEFYIDKEDNITDNELEEKENTKVLVNNIENESFIEEEELPLLDEEEVKQEISIDEIMESEEIPENIDNIDLTEKYSLENNEDLNSIKKKILENENQGLFNIEKKLSLEQLNEFSIYNS